MEIEDDNKRGKEGEKKNGREQLAFLISRYVSELWQVFS